MDEPLAVARVVGGGLGVGARRGLDRGAHVGRIHGLDRCAGLLRAGARTAQQGEEMLQNFAFESRRMDGNGRFDVLTQASRPNHMTIVAVWSNPDTWKRHTAAAPTKEFRKELLPKSGSLYDERLYRAVN